MSRVLLVGLPKNSSAKLAKIFGSVGVKSEECPAFNTAMDKILIDPPSLVVAGNPDAVESLVSLHELMSAKAPVTPLIVRLKNPDVKEAMRVMRVGAYDCLAEPFDRFQVLAASKRATGRMGHALFVQKVVKRKSRAGRIVLIFMALVASLVYLTKTYYGPPAKAVFLGSANLSGIQWEERTLWVSDWYDATVTEYFLLPGLIRNLRSLKSSAIYHAQDSQPILVANTPESLVTIGADLKIRSHERAVGLPVLEAHAVPGLNPTGLAWDGHHVWSADGQTNLLYQHGEDLSITDSVKSILSPTLGLTYADGHYWVIGGKPLRLAKLKIYPKGKVWEGPYPISDILTEGVVPSGVAVAFDRLWLVSGGDPRMVSRPLSEIEKRPIGWTDGGRKP